MSRKNQYQLLIMFEDSFYLIGALNLQSFIQNKLFRYYHLLTGLMSTFGYYIEEGDEILFGRAFYFIH